MKTTLVDRREVAEGTGGFWFEPESRLDFTAGQTCDLSIPNAPHRDDAGSSRTFTIASPPSEPRLLFATRLTGSAFKRSLLELPLGTAIDLDGPYGSFVLHKNARKPAVFLAGGIGITPFRGIVRDALERALPHRLTLVYSNRTARGAPFLDDLERWAREHDGFRLVATLTADEQNEAWPHLRGRIDADFLARHVADLNRSICYVAGPTGFVTAVRQALVQAGADEDTVRTEEFPGY